MAIMKATIGNGMTPERIRVSKITTSINATAESVACRKNTSEAVPSLAFLRIYDQNESASILALQRLWPPILLDTAKHVPICQES